MGAAAIYYYTVMMSAGLEYDEAVGIFTRSPPSEERVFIVESCEFESLLGVFSFLQPSLYCVHTDRHTSVKGVSFTRVKGNCLRYACVFRPTRPLLEVMLHFSCTTIIVSAHCLGIELGMYHIYHVKPLNTRSQVQELVLLER